MSSPRQYWQSSSDDDDDSILIESENEFAQSLSSPSNKSCSGRNRRMSAFVAFNRAYQSSNDSSSVESKVQPSSGVSSSSSSCSPPIPSSTSSMQIEALSAPPSMVAALSPSVQPVFDPRLSTAQRPTGMTDTTCAEHQCHCLKERDGYCLRHYWLADYAAETVSNVKQMHVAKEVITTERSYRDGLRKIIDGFYKRIISLRQLQMRTIKTEDANTIFHNIKDVYCLSAELCQDLEEIAQERVLCEAIGSTLLHYAPRFRIYQTYLENYDDAISTLSGTRSSDAKFDQFCAWQEKCEGASLESLLIMPIQRLPRYLLLLKELSKHTSDQDAGKADIEAALTRIGAVTSAINASLHLKDGKRKVVQLMQKFEKDDRFEDLSTNSSRALIRRGVLHKLYSQDSRHLARSKAYHFFLFNDLLMYAAGSRRYKMKHMFMLVNLHVSAINNENDNQIQVRIGGEKKQIIIECDSTEKRNDWLQEIQIAIEKQKKSSLEIERFDGSRTSTSTNRSKIAAMMGM